MRRFIAPLLTAAIAVAVLVVPAVGSASSANPECLNRETGYAKLLQPQGGQVYAQTQAGGIAYTLPNAGAPVPALPSFSFSTTGQIDVVIEHQCIIKLGLTVEKEGVGIIHTNAWDVTCAKQTTTDSVTIGLDGGKYNFYLDAVSCAGFKMRRTSDGGVVADPPLPL